MSDGLRRIFLRDSVDYLDLVEAGRTFQSITILGGKTGDTLRIRCAIPVKVKVTSICIAHRHENLTSNALRCGSHSVEAYYSFIDPVRMKGLVGLVG